jgi:isoquinoline 1-oxidoreductase subunit alpha
VRGPNVNARAVVAATDNNVDRATHAMLVQIPLWAQEAPIMVTLQINGSQQSFDGDPNMPLLWYLRDELGLVGTKFGCGMALCGACTVHLDGQATRSCVLPLSSVAGKSITTIEGLSRDGDHPVQKAWRAHNVPQCGYCQSGQIMQAASLLATNSKPTDDDIDSAMAGNICRCGTYPRIRAAIKTAAEDRSTK